MCGISGIIGTGWQASQLEAMVSIQHHRGPDAKGFFVEPGKAGLGHNRLSILDLSEAANQPMYSEDKQVVIVFNGEVYNYLELKSELSRKYVFRTNSDTEVVLNAYREWGPRCLERFIGMFAFAVWDRKEKKLFAARDRFGVKPFYYSVHKECLFFASEIKALWAAGVPKVPDEKVWASWLVHGTYGMPDETFWKDIRQLPAGHCLEWSDRHLCIRRWYDFENRVYAKQELSEEDVAARWLELAKDSVRLRFRSDVPVGFSLSGGLDSSLLLALVHGLFPANRNIEAYTFYTGDERYDELPWVEEMIRLTAFQLNPVKLDVAQVPELFQKVLWHEDEPFGGVPTLAYARLFRRARGKGTIVLLDGQGMDEAWAGYDYYQDQSERLVQGTTHSPLKPECLTSAFKALAEKPCFPEPFESRLQNLQFRDLFYTKIPRALRFNDRISMMHSTELREPFLDHRMVELAFALPSHFKIRNGQGKWLARKIATDFLPGKVSLAPKRPLQTPQREWLGAELSDWTSEMINRAIQTGWFDAKKLKDEWDKYQNGKSDNSFFLWQWVSVAVFFGS